MTFSFDLIEEPWVPVVVDGRPARRSIHELVERPRSVQSLNLADPLSAVALLRQVLLPLWLGALGLPRDPDEWRRRMLQPELDTPRLLDHLDSVRARFNLFSPTAPFGQAAGLRTAKGEHKPLSVLQPDQPAGNNVPLFGCRTEDQAPTLSPADAALALLVAQCFDTAAIKSGAVGDPLVKAGKTTGNPTAPVGQLGVLVPLGGDLAETMALNTPVETAPGWPPLGTPAWRRSPPSAEWAIRQADGLLDLLTWPARRIRLVPEDDNGQVVVRGVVLCAGDRLAELPQYEPHTAWVRNNQPKAGGPPQRPLRHRSGRAAWRGLTALLATRQTSADGHSSSLLLSQLADLRVRGAVPENLRLDLLALQVVYGNQSALVEDIVVDRIPLPVAALPEESDVREGLLEMSAEADALQRAANRFGDRMREAAGGAALPWDRSQRLGDTLIQDLNVVVRSLLRGLQQQPDQVEQAVSAWRGAAWQRALALVQPAVESAPMRTFIGREVTFGNKSVHVRLATAVRDYRADLREALGLQEALEEAAGA